MTKKTYKLSIGANIIKGPWGGGNRFATALADYLKNKGWKVTTDLNDNDIDVILMTDPRKELVSVKYNHLDIAKYLIKKPATLVAYRINNCDASRETKNLNSYYIRANEIADQTIFVSKYLQDIFTKDKSFKNKKYNVVPNGADNNLFNRKERIKWNNQEPLKIVTHHWSTNYNKGVDIYLKLDKLSTKTINSKKIIFTYIGNVDKKYKFTNTNLPGPLGGKKLAKAIKNNHIYVTGARHEGASMSSIEGALCGLPVLYINSGSTPEYCDGFGVMFENTDDLEKNLIRLMNNYEYYYKKMEDFKYTAENMCKGYEKIFLELITQRNKLNLPKRTQKAKNFYKIERNKYIKYKLKIILKRILGK